MRVQPPGVRMSAVITTQQNMRIENDESLTSLYSVFTSMALRADFNPWGIGQGSRKQRRYENWLKKYVITSYAAPN